MLDHFDRVERLDAPDLLPLFIDRELPQTVRNRLQGFDLAISFLSDPDAVVAGKKLFGLHCAECHGETAEGTHRAPTMRSSDVQEAPAGAIFWVLTNGIVWHGMPVWSKLPEPMRWQLVAYIKSLGLKSKDLH